MSDHLFTSDPDSAVMARAYRLWAPVYDVICGRLFLSSRLRAAAIAGRSGRRVLEIGVGTGLSLGDYGRQNAVCGVDLSPDMIERARRRVLEAGLSQVEMLAIMDAHRLEFTDARFDVVVAQFLITLVAEPETVLDEAFRVTAPGGEIILVNHFRSARPWLARLEQALAPAAHKVGLRPDFPFQRIEGWIAGKPGARLIERIESGPLGCFSIVRIGKGLI